jgi:hypothetical protein
VSQWQARDRHRHAGHRRAVGVPCGERIKIHPENHLSSLIPPGV